MTIPSCENTAARTNTTYCTWRKIVRTHRNVLGATVLAVPLLGILVYLHGWQPTSAADTPPSGKLTAGVAFDVTPGLAEGDQRWPAVAAGNGIYLVVWQEGEAMAGVKDTNIFAARVSADGKSLDPKAIPVCTAKGNQIYPTVASDGNQCLLVWSDLRPQKDIPEAYGLWGTFLKDGKPAEVGGRELVAAYDVKSKQVRSYLTPQVRHDGNSFVVGAQCSLASWTYAGSSLYRVTNDGKVRAISGGFLGESFSLACDPASKQAVVWSCSQMEHGHGAVVYLASGFVEDKDQTNHMPVGLQSSFGPRNGLWCAVAHDGKNFVAIVEQTTNHGDAQGKHDSLNVDLVATRIDSASGKLLDTGSIEVPSKGWLDMRSSRKKALDQGLKGEAGLKAAADPKVQERHPAVASTGGGKSLVVYSRRGGVGQFKIHGVVLSE